MYQKQCRHVQVYALVVFLVLTLVSASYSQETPSRTDLQAVSQTGLLPVYGVDFTFDVAWVDSAQFPSKSAQHPNFGVNATFQQIWGALSQSGFNVLRFPVDLRDAQASANRVANLCLWSKNNNVKLVPILIGGDRGKPLGADYSTNVSAFIKALVADLRGGEGQYVESYAQILAFQLENEMNSQRLHGAMSRESAQQRLGQAARQLRKSEQESLKDTGLNATPLMVNSSFDYELIKARVLGKAALDDGSYTTSYESLKQFLTELAAEPDIDLIGVDWFAGSLSAGSVEKFPMLLGSLTSDLKGKQIVFTTGFSTGFRSADEQKNFYTLSFTNLADQRASQGVESPFVGVFFHEALNGTEMNLEPPKPNIISEMQKWDWAAKADELARMWNGQASSDVMAWWLKKVESNMGLVTLKLEGNGNASLKPQPALESLQQIAKTVNEANVAAAASNNQAATGPTTTTENVTTATGNNAAATSANASSITEQPPISAEQPATTTDTGSTDSGIRSALKEKAQQALMAILDLVIQRIGNAFNPSSGSGNSSGGNYDSESNSSRAGSFSIEVAKDLVSINPATPHRDEQVTFQIGVHNQSSDADATGLVVALVDNTAGTLSQATDIGVGRGGTQTVPLTWLPSAEGTYNIAVQVYDASLTSQLANTALDPLIVAALGTTPSPSNPNIKVAPPPPGMFQQQLGAPQIRALTIGEQGRVLTVGQSHSVMLSLSNPYALPLKDVKASLLVDGRQVQSKTVGTVLPRQQRSVLFASVPLLQVGQHEVKVTLESGGLRRVTGFMARQVQVNAKVMTPIPPRQTSGVVVGPIRPVRPVIAGQVKVGGIVAPVQTGGDAKVTQPGVSGGRSVLTPGTTRGIAPPIQPGSRGNVTPTQPARSDTTVPPVQPPRSVTPAQPAQPSRTVLPPRTGRAAQPDKKSAGVNTQPAGSRGSSGSKTPSANGGGRDTRVQPEAERGPVVVQPGRNIRNANTSGNSNRNASGRTSNTNSNSNANVNANRNINRNRRP